MNHNPYTNRNEDVMKVLYLRTITLRTQQHVVLLQTISRTIFWNLLLEFGIKNIKKFWDSNILIRTKDRACVKIIGHNTHDDGGFQIIIFIPPGRRIGLGTQYGRRVH